MSDDRVNRGTRAAAGEEDEVRHLAETSDLSPNQARELIRKYGSDRQKLEEAARTFKAES